MPDAPGPDLTPLARPDGTFALLACDQRETLRTLLATNGKASTDEDLAAFKVAVARAVTPHASGMLIDRVYGLDAVRSGGAVAPGCGLIVAVDELLQQPGQILQGSRLEDEALTPALAAAGAVALKFLVLWQPGDDPAPHLDQVGRFVEGARRLGLISVLEGLVRVPAGSPPALFDETLLAAAEAFAPFRPDLYKTNVPSLGAADPDAMIAVARELSRTIARPWVVLSAGVGAERFPGGVEAACRGGASGFLAGQGVWGPSIAAPDTDADLATGAVARFGTLAAIVAREATPWTVAAAARSDA
jgi:sulfofructosephosphate aldolase